MAVRARCLDRPAHHGGVHALRIIPEFAGRRMTSARRLLFCSRSFYLDDSNGAAVAHRTLAGSLAAWGTPVEALSGVVIDGGGGADPAEVLATRGIAFQGIGGDS